MHRQAGPLSHFSEKSHDTESPKPSTCQSVEQVQMVLVNCIHYMAQPAG